MHVQMPGPKSKAPVGKEWDGDTGSWVDIRLSDFELRRLSNIAENAERLALLGLGEKILPEKLTRKRPRTDRVPGSRPESKFRFRDRPTANYTEERRHANSQLIPHGHIPPLFLAGAQLRR